jgi:hypothetical protein
MYTWFLGGDSTYLALNEDKTRVVQLATLNFPC